MARILVAANSTWNLHNFRRGLIRELLKNGHEVITVSPDPRGIEIDDLKVPHRTCELQRSGTNPLKEISLLWRLGRIVRKERPDALFSFTIKPNIYGSLVCRMFNVAAVPNVSGLGASFLGSPLFRRAILLLYRFAFARAPTVFFQNPDDRALFIRERIVEPAQAKVVPGSGIDLASFVPAELPQEPRFLMIARLLSDKGVREYVEAAHLLRQSLPEASFLLLGDIDTHNPAGIPEQEIREWAQQGAIEYLGAADDVRPFIRDAAAVVLPSYREGLPRTLLEGAAMGRPLIGTDVPGCREVVREGITGFLCEAKSASSLAAAMERLARSPNEQQAQMGTQARAMAEREFDQSLVIAAYLSIVRQVVDEAQSSRPATASS